MDVKIDTGVCPRGRITFSKGNVGMACNMEVRAGYMDNQSVSSIDIAYEDIDKIIAVLQMTKAFKKE